MEEPEHEIEHEDPERIRETEALPTDVEVPDEIEEGLRRDRAAGVRDAVDELDEPRG